MLRNTLIILFAAIAITACNHRDSRHRLTMETLMHADSLLDKELPDSAARVFGRVMPSDITGDDVRAIYNLLATHFDYLNYNKVESDSAINFSIAYFTKTEDRRHLTDAWFYKAMTNYDRGNTAVTMEYLKKAEYEARELKDTAKLHKTIENLAHINSDQGENAQALNYYYENLNLCKAYNNPNWTACAMMNIAVIYNHINNKDSAEYYEKASRPYLKYIPPIHQATFLANEANTYFDKNPEKAERTFREALKIHPTVASCMGMAKLYVKRHETEKAEIMFSKAFDIAKEDIKIDILKRWATMHGQMGQTDRFRQDMHRIIALQDSLYEVRAKNNILNIQHEYDYRMQRHIEQQRHENHITIIITVTFVIIAIIFAVFLFLVMHHRNRLAESQKRITEDQTIMELYLRRTAELEQQCKTKTDDTGNKQKEIDRLYKQIKTLQQHQAEMLHKGSRLYNSIHNGETVIAWSNKDFESFVEYYRMKDLAFVRHLEEDYNGLTAKNKIFEILLHENYPQEEVQRIFGIEASTFRANKTRNNAKKKKQS